MQESARRARRRDIRPDILRRPRRIPSSGRPSPRCRICGAAELAPAGTVDGYRFVACAACGFVFAPAITAERMERLYAASYHGPTDGAPEEGWADPTFLDPAFVRLPKRPLRILDFGTGQSRVPDLLRGAGHRVLAVDLMPPTRPHPDRLTGRLDALPLPARFDLAFAFQVFEHLPEPRAPFEHLLRLLAPGGLLLIHTDMETPERANGLEQWWYATPPDHSAFFRHRTFAALLAETPHRIVFKDAKSVLIRAGRG
jgi:SAM-dependent methyltransferase